MNSCAASRPSQPRLKRAHEGRQPGLAFAPQGSDSLVTGTLTGNFANFRPPRPSPRQFSLCFQHFARSSRRHRTQNFFIRTGYSSVGTGNRLGCGGRHRSHSPRRAEHRFLRSVRAKLACADEREDEDGRHGTNSPFFPDSYSTRWLCFAKTQRLRRIGGPPCFAKIRASTCGVGIVGQAVSILILRL
jgi:hypothetical protein